MALLAMISSQAFGASPISSGADCGIKAITWDGSVYTCTDTTIGTVAAGGVDLSTVTSALAGKLSTSAAIPVGLVDLSTVTSALSGKIAIGAAILPAQVDLSTVTTALASKLSTTAPISPTLVYLSTVTTALATKLDSSTAINPVLVNLTTVTTAINLMAPLAGATFAGKVGLQSRTIAQIRAITPAVGDAYYCSDCSPKKVVIGTGTSVANFADAAGGTFK